MFNIFSYFILKIYQSENEKFRYQNEIQRIETERRMLEDERRKMQSELTRKTEENMQFRNRLLEDHQKQQIEIAKERQGMVHNGCYRRQ